VPAARCARCPGCKCLKTSGILRHRGLSARDMGHDHDVTNDGPRPTVARGLSAARRQHGMRCATAGTPPRGCDHFT
jgi:hypothetical protein